MAGQEDKIPLAHVPFVVILIKATKQWRLNHAGEYPMTANDKAEVKSIIETQMHYLEAKDRENYEEAIGKLYWAYKDPTKLSDHLEIIFDKLDSQKTSEKDKKFWSLVAAL